MPEANNEQLNAKKLLNSIADRIIFHFGEHPEAKTIADDIRHSSDGYMNEEEVGAMVVHLIKEIEK